MQVEQAKPSNRFLYALGAVMIVLGASLVAEFALRVQPKIAGPPSCTSPPAGDVCVAMPLGASTSFLNFSPDNITVVIGVNNTVIWMNGDTVAHTVNSKSIPSGATAFSSGLIEPKATYTLTFTVPGDYHYYCTIHPAWMEAEVMVLPAGST